MSLTDDWKAERLKKEKDYFVKTLSNGKIYPAHLYDDNSFSFCGNRTRYFPYGEQKIKVLAICSYDHFVKLTEKVNSLEKEIIKGDTIIGGLLNEGAHIKKENKQLRQTIEKCRTGLKSIQQKAAYPQSNLVFEEDYDELFCQATDVLAKINEVLNDNKF